MTSFFFLRRYLLIGSFVCPWLSLRQRSAPARSWFPTRRLHPRPPPLPPTMSSCVWVCSRSRSFQWERPMREENRELAALVKAYRAAIDRGERDALQPFEQFLQEHPNSAWKASLQVDLGAVYRQTGHFSKALETWQAAWRALRDSRTETEEQSQTLRLATFPSWRQTMAASRRSARCLMKVRQRPVRGSATELVSESRNWASRKCATSRNFLPLRALRSPPHPRTQTLAGLGRRPSGAGARPLDARWFVSQRGPGHFRPSRDELPDGVPVTGGPNDPSCGLCIGSRPLRRGAGPGRSRRISSW